MTVDEPTSVLRRCVTDAFPSVVDELPTTVLAVTAAPPVFVDDSGRRRRTLAAAGATVGVLCVLYLGVVLLGVVRGAENPLLGPIGGLLPDVAADAGTGGKARPRAAAPAGSADAPVDTGAVVPPADVRNAAAPSLPVASSPVPSPRVPAPGEAAAPAVPAAVTPRTPTRTSTGSGAVRDDPAALAPPAAVEQTTPQDPAPPAGTEGGTTDPAPGGTTEPDPPAGDPEPVPPGPEEPPTPAPAAP